MPDKIAEYLIGQGPAGVIMLCLVLVVVTLFKRLDEAREAQIAQGAKYAEIVVTAAKAIETANTNATSIIEAVQTFKLLTDFDRRQRV